MRIIIELDPSEQKPSVTTETSVEADVMEAVEGGAPPDYLVEALSGEAPPKEEEPASIDDYDGGPIPEWLVAAIESVISDEHEIGDGTE
jgi:hypothetical protein